MSAAMPRRKKWLKIILPPAVVILAIVLTAVMVKMRPEQARKEPVPNHPKVEVFTVKAEPVRILVESQGTVQPRQKTRLTSRVSGQIESVSPSLYDGGQFREGEVLLQLDPLPYESALAEARSRLALAKAALLQEREAAEQARSEWQAVGKGEANPLVLRVPQLEKAEADLEAARVAVEMAERNLHFTRVRAPYDGRVEAKYVDVGQSITAQATILADIFSTGSLEVPLPVALDDLAYVIDLSKMDTGHVPLPERPLVFLTAGIAGTSHTWEARLERTAAQVNAQTRMITAYAGIPAPYRSDRGQPLKPGLFVRATIQGRLLEDATRIPRGALQPGNIVYRINGQDRLESVPLRIVRTDARWAIATNGLEPGDRLCVTPLLFFVEGMRVEPVNPSPSPETGVAGTKP